MNRLAAIGAAVIALAVPMVVAVAVDASEAERDRMARYLVRLTDLGPGYGVGNDGGCGIGPSHEGASPRLRRFNHKDRSYHGCAIDFRELWRPVSTAPRPRKIDSVAIRFSRLADARAAFRIGPDFAHYNVAVSPRSLKRLTASRTVGDEFRMYRTNDALVDGIPRRPAVVVIWRTGRTLSILLVSGKADAVVQEEALRLAETQQSRVVKPTQLPAHANDDRFVSLNNPAAAVPVYWLGLRFRAPGLPRLAFDDGWTMSGDDESGPEYSANVSYSGVGLGIWRPATWTRVTKSRFGRLVWAARCTKATRVALPTGYAMLFAGHAKHQRRCGRRPDRFLAHVYMPGAVVSVNMPICSACIDSGRRRNPWNSLRGMRAVAEGLTLRPRE